MNVQAVLISGPMGSGKTTLAKELLKIYRDRKASLYTHEITFASPLYEMHDFCRGILKNYFIPVDLKKDGQLLQYLGTEWARNKFGENVWIDIAKAKMKNIFEMRKNDANRSSEDRWKLRSKTYNGIAEAMAIQWSDPAPKADE